MIILVAVFLGIILLLYIAKLYYIVKITKLKKSSNYPLEKEKILLEDVIKLIEKEEIVLAVDLYRKLEKVSLYDAKKKVNELKIIEKQKQDIINNSNALNQTKTNLKNNTKD